MRRSVLHRLFISYILIALLPVALLFALLYNNSVVNLRQEVEAFTVTNTQRIMETMDLRITESKSIAYQIAQNPRLTSFSMLQGNRYAVLEGMEELAKYKAGNAFVSDILLYYGHHDRFFSYKGATSIDVTLNRSFGLSEEERGRFLELLAEHDSAVMATFESTGKILYCVPLSIYGGYQSGSAIFAFEAKSLQNLIAKGKTSFRDATYILDANKRPIVSVNPGAVPLDTEALAAMASLPASGVNIFKYGQESYSVVAALSGETGWYFLSVIPTKQFMEQVNAQELFIIAAAALVLLLCVLAALPLAFTNYRPIRRLLTFASDYWPQPDGKTRFNEIEHIQYAMNNALTVNRSLESRLEDHRQLLWQSLLLPLLKGAEGGADRWRRYLETTDGGMPEASAAYTVLVVRYDAADDEAAKYNESLLNTVADEYSVDGAAYCVESGNGNTIAVVVCDWQGGSRRLGAPRRPDDPRRTDDPPRPTPADVAERLLAAYPQPVRERIRIGIGKTYDELTKVHTSYIEAMGAAEPPAASQADQPIVTFHDMLLSQESYWVKVEDELHFFHSLKQGDARLALEAFERIAQEIRGRPTPDDLHRYAWFKAADIAVKAYRQHEWPSGGGPPASADGFAERVGQALNANAFSEFSARMRESIEWMCASITDSETARAHHLVTNVLAFVHDGYKDPNMGLDAISGRFGSSNYYWSRFFKEQVHTHFSEYLWKLRFAEAKRLLLDTALPIKDIVTAVGYIDLTSFIRRFKQDEGLTPGRYRKMYASAEDRPDGRAPPSP